MSLRRTENTMKKIRETEWQTYCERERERERWSSNQVGQVNQLIFHWVKKNRIVLWFILKLYLDIPREYCLVDRNGFHVDEEPSTRPIKRWNPQRNKVHLHSSKTFLSQSFILIERLTFEFLHKTQGKTKYYIHSNSDTSAKSNIFKEIEIIFEVSLNIFTHCNPKIKLSVAIIWRIKKFLKGDLYYILSLMPNIN